MASAKELASKLIDELPDESVPDIINYIYYIKYKNNSSFLQDLCTASVSSTDFWDNDIDDEVWNNA